MPFDMKSARHWAQELQKEAILPGMRVIDATMGNGHDTQWLCELVGETGHVYAFDIQPSAVEHTKSRLEAAGLLDRATLICDGHQNVRKHVEGPVDAVLFNLGWLPGGDHSCTTRLETTLAAVSECLELLAPGGLMTICAYPGHEEGRLEGEELQRRLAGLPKEKFDVFLYRLLNVPESPYMIVAERRG